MASPSSNGPYDLPVTLSHAIAYLTRATDVRFDLIAVSKLCVALEAELSNAFISSWDPSNPVRGSGLRCLTINPAAMPPRPIYNACLAAGVQWADWGHTIAGCEEFDLFIDPGEVCIRMGLKKPFTVWCASRRKPASRDIGITMPRHSLPQALLLGGRDFTSGRTSGKTVAQQLCEMDDHDELFFMIADEMAEPTWNTPVKDQFAAIAMPGARPSLSLAIPTHSRASSTCSLVSSSASSAYSSGSAESSYFGSYSSACDSSNSSQSSPQVEYRSRRARQRESKVFIDNTRKDVTPYDGGKTTVLGGGVMLGAPSDGHRRVRSNASGGTSRM